MELTSTIRLPRSFKPEKMSSESYLKKPQIALWMGRAVERSQSDQSSLTTYKIRITWGTIREPWCVTMKSWWKKSIRSGSSLESSSWAPSKAVWKVQLFRVQLVSRRSHPGQHSCSDRLRSRQVKVWLISVVATGTWSRRLTTGCRVSLL